MQALPHFYKVKSSGQNTGNLKLSVDNLPDIEIAPPVGFGGPGDTWSPEDLLISSVSTCTILSFRVIAKASRFEWISIECESTGELSRVAHKTLFTKIHTKAKLTIAKDASVEKAKKLLIKAEQTCLVSNSLSSERTIECEIIRQD
jgi:peroxiredoxin-like protein